MYAALWRALPGPMPVRVVIFALLVLAVMAACVLWLFPWVADRLPMNDADIEGAVTVLRRVIDGSA